MDRTNIAIREPVNFTRPIAHGLTRWQIIIATLLVLASAVVPYLPFLSLPFISDSYLQVFLGRYYGPVSRWDDLAGDVLYRSRATSLVVTFIVDHFAGPDPAMHRMVNILFHVANSLLVAGFGSWKRIGWHVSIPAAVCFALCEVHQEAVIWTAALPELLVFLFSVLSILAWLRAIERSSNIWIAVSFFSYLLALVSKESAVVVPVAATAIWTSERRNWSAPWIAIALMAVCAVVYAIGIFSATGTHLHLNDGTFSFRAPFLFVVWKSLLRLLLPWGWVGIALLAIAALKQSQTVVMLSIGWIIVSFLPYSFLTYMDRVPSRHTYLASLGLAMVIGAAHRSLRISGLRWGPALAALFAVAIASHSLFYLWTKKLDQYVRRAEPTENFLRFAAESRETQIRVICAPYGFEAFRYAAMIRLQTEPSFVIGHHEPSDPQQTRTYCDSSTP